MKPDHELNGYKAGSSGYKHGCRCDECKMSNRKYQQKHRAIDETHSADQADIIESISEPVISVPISEPETVIPVRDESIPYQIIDALAAHDYRDTVIYEDGGEGWELEDLAAILISISDVTCEIHGQKLHVIAIIEEIPAEVPSPMTMIGSMTITGPERVSNYPSQPRVIPKAPTAIPAKPRNITRAAAPTVPSTPYRAPMSVNHSANTVETFSL